MSEQKDYQQLRHTASSLLERIEQNQRIQARFYDYEFKLLSCRRLEELFDQLIAGAARHFRLSAVSLALYDPDYSLADLRDYLELGDFRDRLSLHHSREFFDATFGRKPVVTLGELDQNKASQLFPGVEAVGSAALLPLLRQQRLFGSLHFASYSRERYSADKAVSFMWHLASIVAVCLENSIALEQLQRQGQEDTLTKVRNRRGFEVEFSRELERAARQAEALSCLFVDIDYFKQINDAYGHQVGDLCLRQVAQVIAQQLRKTDSLARYGGEEFVVLLPSCAQEEAAVSAERIRQAVSDALLALPGGDSIPLTVSVGFSSWQAPAKRSQSLQAIGEQLLKQADLAMYKAKQAGRNRVCFEPFEADIPAAGIT